MTAKESIHDSFRKCVVGRFQVTSVQPHLKPWTLVHLHVPPLNLSACLFGKEPFGPILLHHGGLSLYGEFESLADALENKENSVSLQIQI
eukprot:gene11822-biopygen16124